MARKTFNYFAALLAFTYLNFISPYIASASETASQAGNAQPTIGSLRDIIQEIAGYDTQIRQYQLSVAAKQVALAEMQKDIVQLQAINNEAETRVASLHAKREKAIFEAEVTKKTLKAAIDNPRLVDTPKLNILLKDSQMAAGELENSERDLSIAQKEAGADSLRLKELHRQKRLTELEMGVVNRTILNLLVKRPVIVEGIGECVMHEDISPKECKNIALAKAKQDAIEKGGLSLVQSFSEVRMHDLIKDEIKIETRAYIRQMELVQAPTRIEEEPLGKYSAKIRAVVQSTAQDIGQRTDYPSHMEKQKSGRPAAESLDQGQAKEDLSTVFNVAYNAYLNGRYDSAVADFQRFLKTYPSNSLTANAYYWMGESYLARADWNRATEAFDHVVQHYPENEKVPGALYKLGVSANQAGDNSKARAYYRRLIEEYPRSDEAKLAKASLGKLR